MCERLASREVTPGFISRYLFYPLVRERNLPRPRCNIVCETCLKKFILVPFLFTLLSRRSQAGHGSLPSAYCEETGSGISETKDEVKTFMAHGVIEQDLECCEKCTAIRQT